MSIDARSRLFLRSLRCPPSIPLGLGLCRLPSTGNDSTTPLRWRDAIAHGFALAPALANVLLASRVGSGGVVFTSIEEIGG